jgi:hypothetical protein
MFLNIDEVTPITNEAQNEWLQSEIELVAPKRIQD